MGEVGGGRDKGDDVRGIYLVLIIEVTLLFYFFFFFPFSFLVDWLGFGVCGGREGKEGEGGGEVF